MYVYDKKTFSSLHRRGRSKKRQLKNEATPAMLLKKNGGKTPAGATPTMFMKTSNLFLYTYDIYENKGSCSSGSTAPKALEGSTPEAEVSPAIAHFRQREQKRIIKYTFEARMSMKTKEHKTRYPNENRLLVLNFRHLRRIKRYFAENCWFATISCQLNSVFRGFIRA
jgi:hypothetical protein